MDDFTTRDGYKVVTVASLVLAQEPPRKQPRRRQQFGAQLGGIYWQRFPSLTRDSLWSLQPTIAWFENSSVS